LTTGDSTCPLPEETDGDAVAMDTASGAEGALATGAAGAGAGAAGAAAAGGAGAGLSEGGAGASVAAGALALPAPSPLMTASRSPTSTVPPSWTMISERTPSAGDGTSESTLSVDTSNSGSSLATCSPTDFNHLVTVPSVTVSPSCGMVTSGNVKPPSGQSQHRLAECLRQPWVRLHE